jgi:hypothetical protein
LAKLSQNRLITIFSDATRSVSLYADTLLYRRQCDANSSTLVRDDTRCDGVYALGRSCCAFPVNFGGAIDNGICQSDVRLLHGVGGSPANKRFQGPEEGCFRQAIHRREKQIRGAAAILFLPYRCDRWLRYRRACSRGSHQADAKRETVDCRTRRTGNAGGLTRHGRAEPGAL